MKRKHKKRFLLFGAICTLALCLAFPLASYASDEAEPTSELTEENPFDELYSIVEEHITEILSGLSFAGALIIAFSYKKGFIPLVESGIKALSGGVKSIAEKTDEIGNKTASLFEELERRLKNTEEESARICKAVLVLQENLISERERAAAAKKMTDALICEIDMLCEVFTCAALPQYLKDRIEEKSASIKKMLASEEDDGQATEP